MAVGSFLDLALQKGTSLEVFASLSFLETTFFVSRNKICLVDANTKKKAAVCNLEAVLTEKKEGGTLENHQQHGVRSTYHKK